MHLIFQYSVSRAIYQVYLNGGPSSSSDSRLSIPQPGWKSNITTETTMKCKNLIIFPTNLVAGVWTIRWYVLYFTWMLASLLCIWKESEPLFLIMLLAKPKYRGFYLYIQWAHLLHCKQTAYTTILSFQISLFIRIIALR